jgi:hypothetical protein
VSDPTLFEKAALLICHTYSVAAQAAAASWNTTNGKFNRFSQQAMVTPAISGLRNVDALQVCANSIDCNSDSSTYSVSRRIISLEMTTLPSLPRHLSCVPTTLSCSLRLTPASSLPLQALMDAGIVASVGDTSWPHLRNQANPWQAQVLSVAANQTVDGAARPRPRS